VPVFVEVRFTVQAACGRSAARSDALQTRDRKNSGVCNGPGSAQQHFMLLPRPGHAVHLIQLAGQ
jgi:hypothetical protein